MTLVFINVSAGFCRADSQRTGPVECADGDRLWPHDLAARAYLSDALCRHYRLRVHARRREGAGLLLFLLYEVSTPPPTPARHRPIHPHGICSSTFFNYLLLPAFSFLSSCLLRLIIWRVTERAGLLTETDR